MSTPITLTLGQLAPPGNPPPGCYASEQARAAGFVAAITASFVQNNSTVVISPTAPAISQDYLWLSVVGPAGGPYTAINGLYASANGFWTPVARDQYYFTGNDLSGAANVYSVPIPVYPLPYAYLKGDTFLFVPAHTNTGASTFQVGALVATNITVNGATLIPSQLLAGYSYLVQYNGVTFELINPNTNFPRVDVFATSPDTTMVLGNSDIDLSFPLPAGATKWVEVELIVNATLDSAAASLGYGTATLLWNCGALLLSPVVQSPTTGSGNSASMYYSDQDSINTVQWSFRGIVPGAINNIPTLICHATLALSGNLDVAPGAPRFRHWSFWGTAVAQ